MNLTKEQKYEIEECLFELKTGRKFERTNSLGIDGRDFAGIAEVNPFYHRILRIIQCGEN